MSVPNPFQPPYRQEGPRRPWTAEEIAILERHYPEGGARACAPYLPDRTLANIGERARSRGLKWRTNPYQYSKPSTEMLDAAIRRLYLKPMKPGLLVRFCANWGRSKWWVRKRAQQLGLSRHMATRRAWTAEEDALLEEHEGKGAETLAKILRRHGYARSVAAVAARLRNKGLIDRDQDPDLFSTGQLAEIFGIDRKAIHRWTEKGWIKTQRAIVNGSLGQTATRRAARDFLIAHPYAWDHRAVDKMWLIDTLTCQ